MLAIAAAAGLTALALAAGSVSAVDYATASPTAMATPAASPTATVAAATEAPASLALGSRSTTLGTVLTGPNGMTLYTLSSDPNGGSVCTGQCLVFWPPLLVAAGGSVTGPTGATGTYATFVRTDDGSTQVTLDGRPLYYFKNDTAPGQTNGEGIKGAGGIWHVAMAAVASATAASATGTPHTTLPPTSTIPTRPAAPGDGTTAALVVLFLGALAAGSLRLAPRRRRD